MNVHPTKSLWRIFKFLHLTYLFRKVEREVLYTKEERKENDLEHSAQLALLSWYIINTQNLKLDESKVFKYALAHDLVEVDAGDTFAFDKQGQKSKLDRE